ncbi:MAG: glycosyltransferase [Pseudomonadales bacterium]|nr:glycosyltransferase [Pseudomonadales bacterium]
MQRILHVHSQARFQGGIERILFDIASSLAPDMEQGLLFTDGGSDLRFLAPFTWQGMGVAEALARFKPDLAIIHKTDDIAIIDAVIGSVPTIVFPHDHDLTCPRRHKYLPMADKPCLRAAGAGCIKHLCFVERAQPGQTLPVTLFAGIQRQRQQLKASARAKHFLVASSAMRVGLILNGICSSKIKIIAPIPASLDGPLGSSTITPLSNYLDAQGNTGTAPLNLLFVGQVIRGKGVDLMLQALARLDLDFHATIVGEGNHLAYCKQLALQLGLRGRVTFTGWVDHDLLENYYQQCRCLIVPSRWPEPFGMVGVEAMARGRPVVAFDVGGISDWLSHEHTGYLAAAGDVADLARQLQRALTADVEMAAMAANAQLAARQHFSHQGFIERLRAYISEVIELESRPAVAALNVESYA